MIEKLVVRNQECHGKLVLQLDPHVTTIVGPTDSGKSAITRALRWVSLNKLRSNFRKHGTDKSSVTLYVDGHKVTRTRGKKRNTYSLDGKRFGAIGKEVPEAISSLLALSDLNFQRQIDPPFWFTESAGEVSRRLNQVVDLSLIDHTLAKLNAQERAARAEFKVSCERLEKAKKELDDLLEVKLIDHDLRALEKADAVLSSVEDEMRELESCLEDLREDQATVDKLSGVLEECGRAVRDLDKTSRRLVKVEEELGALEDLDREAYELQEALVSLEVELHETRQEFGEEMGKACPLCGKETT